MKKDVVKWHPFLFLLRLTGTGITALNNNGFSMSVFPIRFLSSGMYAPIVRMVIHLR